MAVTFGSLLEENLTQTVFERALQAWARRDLVGLMPLVSEGILNSTNIDPSIVPFAASVKGKSAYEDKLGGILETFDFGAYVTEHLVARGRVARANMKVIWIHRSSGERLNTRFRFVAHQQDGQLVQLFQYYDAPYVEAFARHISKLA